MLAILKRCGGRITYQISRLTGVVKQAVDMRQADRGGGGLAEATAGRLVPDVAHVTYTAVGSFSASPQSRLHGEYLDRVRIPKMAQQNDSAARV
jgi:hypothetical protein